jgi:hypothetical protein
MKNIFLSVVIICALAVAGIGGVFANYQDIETSHLNYVETGDLDLLVSHDGYWFEDPDVPILVDADNFMPECQDKSFHFDLHNVGDYEQGTGYVYFHIKNLVFTDTGRTEPEEAAEIGDNPVGELDDGTIISPGGAHNLGYGWGTANGALADHIRFDVYTSPTGTGSWTQLDLSDYDVEEPYDEVKLSEIVCYQIPICELDSDETIYVKFDLWLQDIPEELLGRDLFPGTDSKWNDWPTNALQNDQVEFDVSFELFQFELPPDVPNGV